MNDFVTELIGKKIETELKLSGSEYSKILIENKSIDVIFNDSSILYLTEKTLTIRCPESYDFSNFIFPKSAILNELKVLKIYANINPDVLEWMFHAREIHIDMEKTPSCVFENLHEFNLLEHLEIRNLYHDEFRAQTEKLSSVKRLVLDGIPILDPKGYPEGRVDRDIGYENKLIAEGKDPKFPIKIPNGIYNIPNVEYFEIKKRIEDNNLDFLKFNKLKFVITTSEINFESLSSDLNIAVKSLFQKCIYLTKPQKYFRGNTSYCINSPGVFWTSKNKCRLAFFHFHDNNNPTDITNYCCPECDNNVIHQIIYQPIDLPYIYSLECKNCGTKYQSNKIELN
ncbi:MAG: hypothetical protein INQ03_24265 [Candidatus Heimdallarchaeota archaeon]|nr:hypothetical protein [Candidatus Heimdallarchaeota archaeon]